MVLIQLQSSLQFSTVRDLTSVKMLEPIVGCTVRKRLTRKNATTALEGN